MTRLALTIVLLATPALADDLPAVPTFTPEPGLTHVYAGEWEFIVGGGVAVFDCDADGRQDMVMAGGTNPAALYHNLSTTGGPLQFEPLTSGLEETAVSGAYALDVDSDGILDVMLLRVGENKVMRGLGACRFEPANARWGLDGGDAWTTAFAATWEGGATWPTLAFGNYIDRREEAFPWGSCTDNWLHRPDPQGIGFGPPQPLKPSFCALSMLFTDWNRSGTPSLRVSNDREYYKGGQEQLWHMGVVPRLYTPDEGWAPLKIWGMGIASQDVTGDGFPEYVLTSMADTKMQSLADPTTGKARFADIAFAKGTTAQRPYVGADLRPSTGWHAQFDDVNNDGRADLFIAKGNVSDMPDFAAQDPNNLLLQGADGRFHEAGDKAGVASMAQGRGAALADFNRDGLLDLLVVNRNAPAELWRNTSKGLGHWLQIALHQQGVNPDGVGAWIEVTTGAATMTREVTVGGGHAGGVAGWWHFGLGDAAQAEARVIWPDGTIGPWQSLDANAAYVLTPGSAPVPQAAP